MGWGRAGRRTEADRAEYDDCDEDHDEQHDELHLEVLPPHLVPQCPSRLVKFIRLEPEVVRPEWVKAAMRRWSVCQLLSTGVVPFECREGEEYSR